MKEYICKICGTTFKRYPSTIRNENTATCSKKCYGERLKKEWCGENNPNFKKGDWCQESYCACGRLKDCRSEKCSKCSKKSYSKNPADRIEDNTILDEIKNNDCIIETAKKLEISRSKVSTIIDKYKPDITHFKNAKGRSINLENIFCISKTRRNGTVKKHIIENNLLPYKCEKCELTNSWNGLTLTLELDHINGNPRDNTLSNLRFLCPNCHSQTPTNKGKNNKTKL